MKILFALFTLVVINACAPAGKDLSQGPAQTSPSTQNQCATYDSCTYSGGFSPEPVYNCVSKTIQAADHPEIAESYFKGESCLTYREDYHTETVQCGPMNQYQCPTQVQGPGAQAIPELNL